MAAALGECCIRHYRTSALLVADRVPLSVRYLIDSRRGWEPASFYVLTAVDRVDPDPTVTLTDTASGNVFGPFPSGTKVKLTQAPGAPPSRKNGPRDVDWHITLNGDAEVRGIDGSGNVSEPASCLVPPKPK